MISFTMSYMQFFVFCLVTNLSSSLHRWRIQLAAIISGAVIEGLKVAGILAGATSDASKEDTNQSASV